MHDTPKDDLLAEVEERAANTPRIWDPEGRLTDRDDTITEQSVAGFVEEIDERESGFGPYKTTVLRRRDGSRAQVAWFGTVLEQRSKNLDIGDAVAVSYLGRVQPKDPTLGMYSNFEVIHRKPASGPRIVAEEPPEEPPAAVAASNEADLPLGPGDAVAS